MLNLNLKFFQNIKNYIFPFYRNKELQFIFKKLNDGSPKNAITARFVGGCVRKYLTKEKIDDIDVATLLTTDQIKEKFKDTNLQVLDTGLKHGTVTVVSQNYKVEITTLRKDIRTDGRHAEIEFTNDWYLDSERRDFTMNAIYLDIKGNIFDPQMGTSDLKNKNVKFIGDPQKRIEEDYLRIIRFIRFKILYDPKVEKTTGIAIKQNLDGIKKISKERILSELLKILELKNFLKLNENESLKEIFILIFPEFLYLNRLKRLEKVYDLPKLNKELILATLLIDEKDNLEYFYHKYNLSNRIQKNLNKITLNLNEIVRNKDFFTKDLLKNLYINGKDHLIDLNLVNFAKNSTIKFQDFSKILQKILSSRIPKFQINGEYLKQNGMTEGTSLGKALKIIENEWLENNFKISKDRVREIIKTFSD
mgnify:CR=1 FL=1|tara:strand:- start:1802 stop:3064 length:1263 start_codon:yes stop_codon:yes gene_type:complete